MARPTDFVLGTAGHIDHGKTSLVRALTGIDTDRLPDEKRRGITIDLGFAALNLGDLCLAIVDVPGHERFIRNMLAGATGFDLAMLVVAADDSVMPQTREHLEILRLLDLGAGLVALTKCDLVEGHWLDLVEDEVRSLARGTFLEGRPIIRTSTATGSGIDELRSALGTLCQTVVPRPDPGLFRIAIDRSFTAAGHGTIVSGTVASGGARLGDDLELLPVGRHVRVRGLQRHDSPVDSIGRGTRAAINLGGVHHSEVSRGDELASGGYLAPSRALSVEVRGTAGVDRPLRHQARYRLHLGTSEVSARLTLLMGESESCTTPSLGQLFLSEPVVAVHGEPFVLRAESPPETLGGGRVLEPLARRIRRRDPAGLARLDSLRSPDPTVRIAAALAARGLDGWTDRTLCRDTGVPVGEIPLVLDRLRASGAMVEVHVGPRRTIQVLSEVAADLEDRLLRALARLHDANPRLSAIPRARVAAALAYLDNEALVSGLIDGLSLEGKVTADARTVALRGYEPRLSQGERRLKAEIAAAFKTGGMVPPDLSRWTARTNPKAHAVPELLTLLCEEERIVRLGPDLFLDFEVAADLRGKVRDRLANGSSMTMSELRDLLGTTRKYSVPIGEYLDRIGLTRREGDVRRLLDLQPDSGTARP